MFCGAGGVSRGLSDAGFEVVGVDLVEQPRYPFEFRRGDALAVDLGGFDLVWASPPCQRYMTGGVVRRERAPDLIGPVRKRLKAWGGPWIIENVPGAPMRRDVMLCGSMFGLPLRRHRLFEMSFEVPKQPGCRHAEVGPIVGVYGHPHGKAGAWPGMRPSTIETWREAMGIDWMNAKEITQAIPPAYAEFLGQAALSGGQLERGCC